MTYPNRLKSVVSEYIEGIKILFSKRFWTDFFGYYSSREISKRLDDFAKQVKERNSSVARCTKCGEPLKDTDEDSICALCAGD